MYSGKVTLMLNKSNSTDFSQKCSSSGRLWFSIFLFILSGNVLCHFGPFKGGLILSLKAETILSNLVQKDLISSLNYNQNVRSILKQH